MSAGTVARGWSYEASVPYEKPSSLEALHGPTVGTVQVDPTISTAPDPSFDLADRVMRAWLYQQVVRDGRSDQQEALLARDWLVELWPELMLPDRCRAEWEAAFPELVS